MRVFIPSMLIVAASAGAAAQVRSDDASADPVTAEQSNGTTRDDAQDVGVVPPTQPVRPVDQGSTQQVPPSPVLVPPTGAAAPGADPSAAGGFLQPPPSTDLLRPPGASAPAGVSGVGPSSPRPPDVSSPPQAADAAGAPVQAGGSRSCGPGETGTAGGSGSTSSRAPSQGVGVSASQFQPPGVGADKFERPGVSAAQLAALLPGARPACAQTQDPTVYTAPANQPQPRVEPLEEEPR